MKNKLSKIVFSTFLVTGSLMAQSIDNTYSLVGIEGGYNSVDVDMGESSNSKHKMPYAGLKLGAQTDEYRLFTSVRYFSGDDFDYITTYGLELQYLLNFSKSVNFYFGINTGIANIKYSPVNGEKYRTTSDGYFGGDAGISMHLSDTTDLEIGLRYIDIGASNTIKNVTYTFNSMTHGYASLIYKFQIDE